MASPAWAQLPEQREDQMTDILEPPRVRLIESAAWGARSPALRGKIVIHPDATYIVDLCNHKLVVRANIILTVLVKHLWRQVSEFFFLEAVWTKAHAYDNANNYVDRLADLYYAH